MNRIFGAFDLCGRDGRASFGKLVTVAVLVGVFLNRMPVILGVALLAAALGRTAFVAFLNRATFGVSQSESKTTQLTGTLDNRYTDDER